MASLLGSHPQIVHAFHENKLIVERDGLMDLVQELSSRFDMARQHFAVVGFANRARKYRALGFQNEALNDEVRRLASSQNLSLQHAFDAVARRHPNEDLSIHRIGTIVGLDHYDRCVKAFLDRLCQSISKDGILMADGLVRPFVVPHRFTRAEILAEARRFLDELYGPALSAAGASRWCDDTPSNWLYADFLHELYPSMRFIHMVRAPQEVTSSFMNQIWAPSDPRQIVALLRRQFEGYDMVRARIPDDRILEVRLEDLTEDFDGAMARVAGFLDIEPRFDRALFRGEVAAGRRRADGRVDGDASRLVETELATWIDRYGYGASA